jgi:hypothetical protein
MKEVEEEATSADGHQGPHANPAQQVGTCHIQADMKQSIGASSGGIAGL